MSRAREFADLAGSADAGGITGRNLIINGAMQVAQRGTVTGLTSGNYGGPDRIKTQPSGLGTWTVEKSTDAPDGFSNSYKLTCTTADSSPAAGDYIQIRFITEGQNVQQLDYGSSGALATTISFYVKSSKTGTFTYVLRTFDSGAGTRLFSKNVTISSANTWEYKTVTAPGDASGAINNDNTMGLDAAFWLNAGSSFSGGSEQTTWANQNNVDKYLGTIDLGNATGETFQITGVQLEVGEQATPFEHRSFHDELRRCKRYFERFAKTLTSLGQASEANCGLWSGMSRSGNSGNNQGVMTYQTKRTNPSISVSSAAHINGVFPISPFAASLSSFGIDGNAGIDNCFVNAANNASTAPSSDCGSSGVMGNSSGTLDIDAEL